jgi:type IV pilus assembly protein PilM
MEVGPGSTTLLRPFAAVWRRFKSLGRDSFVALDIGSNAIKAIEVRGSGTDPEVTAVGSIPLGEGMLVNNTLVDPDGVARLLVDLRKRSKMTARLAITAVPGPAVIVKKVSFRPGPDDDIDALVMIEAANFIPENMENVNLDFQVVRAEGSDVEALLVAVRKDILAGFTSAVEGADLDLRIVDVDSFALENVYELNYEPTTDDVVGLVDIGARYSTVNIAKGGLSSTTGDVPAGGNMVTDALVRLGGMSPIEARRALSGEAPDDRIRGIAADASAQLADSIGDFVSFLSRTGASDVPMRAVYVGGGGALIPGVIERLGSNLEVPVEILDPFRRVRLGPNVDPVELEGIAPLFAVAMGLGTRRPGDE